MTESAYNEAVLKISELTNEELDRQLEEAAILSEKSEMLICCYLSAVCDRQAFRDFGYSTVYDYAEARFGFRARKTRYLVALGRKIKHLPRIREALASGKIGWCKASRIASVAAPESEVMWLDSALSLSVQQLDRRIKDGTDTLASMLHLPLTEERRILWENGLEIYRRRAGAEISPVEAFELMLAEVVAEWGHHLRDTDAGEADAAEDPETTEVEVAPPTDEPEASVENQQPDEASPEQPVFPWAEGIDSDAAASYAQGRQSELAAENAFAANPDYNELRQLVLDRDGWKCSYPGCGARAQLHVHHVRFRSRGGGDVPWNLTTVCNFHHDLIHAEQVGVQGRAPLALEWSPPKMMRAVLERRRNNPSIWLDDLQVREWSLETPAASGPAGT